MFFSLAKGCDNIKTDCRKEIGHFSKISRAGCFLKVDQLTLDCWKLKRVQIERERKVPFSPCQFLLNPSLFIMFINDNTWIVFQVHALSDVFWHRASNKSGTGPREAKWLSHRSHSIKYLPGEMRYSQVISISVQVPIHTFLSLIRCLEILIITFRKEGVFLPLHFFVFRPFSLWVLMPFSVCRGAHAALLSPTSALIVIAGPALLLYISSASCFCWLYICYGNLRRGETVWNGISFQIFSLLKPGWFRHL